MMTLMANMMKNKNYLSRLRQYLSLVSPANGKYSWQTYNTFMANQENMYGKSSKYLWQI